MILCILPCDFCKLFVDPEKFSLRIHNGIGQRQFLDQMLLNLTVFGRKGNQLVDHLRTLSVIENCGCDHIDCKKQREPHSCHHIHKIHADIHHKHQDGQNQRPSKIAPQLAAQLHFESVNKWRYLPEKGGYLFCIQKYLVAKVQVKVV